MSEMVERCVKAGIAGETDFAQWHPDVQVELVRTIIEAMREPTEEMTRRYFGGKARDTFVYHWHNGIDAALK